MTRLIISTLATLALSAGTASAQSMAVGASLGTTGAGIEAQLKLGPIFVLRASVDRLDHNIDETYDGIDYAGAFAFDTLGGFVDLHPFGNAFLVSGGAYLGDRDISLGATPSMPVEIGGTIYSPSQVGTLSGTIKLQDLAPFVGVGWDDTFTRRSAWGFRALAGLAFSDTPEVALDSTGGSLSNSATLQDRLDDEAREIQGEVEGYGLFPVVQVGLNYRF
ncbi:hypothetical protein GVN24_23870 [Rhizobium sp. CRIBSB]|nr:hypothetical protein [Rhizobium sp. CRIBSB]